MAIEDNFPLEQLTPIAKAEASSRQNYRPIYSLHKWWAQRLGSVFRTIGLSTFMETNDPKEVWEHYFQKSNFADKIVLDPFMGGGTTIVELNRLGAKTIGIDINPVSWWTVREEMQDIDINELKRAFTQLEKTVAEDIKKYYKTTCPHCNKKADVMYFFWVRKVNCITCNEEVRLFKYHIIAKENETHDAVIVCPNCLNIFETASSEQECTCPECKVKFDPESGPFSGGSYTCSNGHKYKVVKTVQREKSAPKYDLYAIEYYCSVCRERGYKPVEKEDLQLYSEAKKELESNKNYLLPTQKIQPGEKTNEIINYNYNYFYQLFNERQLLSISKLIKAILNIENKEIKYLLLTALSSSLEYQTILCQYNYTKRHIVNLFNHHAYAVTMMPVENNMWGSKIGAGTYKSYFTRLYEAKDFCLNPFEKYRSQNGVIKKQVNGEKISGKIIKEFNALNNNGAKSSMLLCKTSENLSEIPNGSIDAIITDPPYFNNVQYSELADFFYVWLRIGLKEDFEEFKGEYSPKLNEIVKNSVQGKDDDFFIEGLTNVFRECHRVLKDSSPMVFTYHHKQSQAWAAVLEAILSSGFYVSGIYPVTSDPSFNPHIKDKDSIEYDAVIICRKRTENRKTTFEKYEEELYLKAQEIIRNEKKKRPSISKGDISVIVFGKCLEIYSKYYPNITKDGKQISVEEATDKVWEIIDQLSETDYLPPELDPISRAFVLNLYESGGISYDELNKRLRQKGVDVSELEAEYLIIGSKKMKKPAEPATRKSFIEKKIKNGDELLDIDKAQYLYILYTTDKNTIEWLRQWKTPELEQLCAILAEKTGDKRYSELMKMTLDMF